MGEVDSKKLEKTIERLCEQYAENKLLDAEDKEILFQRIVGWHDIYKEKCNGSGLRCFNKARSKHDKDLRNYRDKFEDKKLSFIEHVKDAYTNGSINYNNHINSANKTLIKLRELGGEEYEKFSKKYKEVINFVESDFETYNGEISFRHNENCMEVLKNAFFAANNKNARRHR